NSTTFLKFLAHLKILSDFPEHLRIFYYKSFKTAEIRKIFRNFWDTLDYVITLLNFLNHSKTTVRKFENIFKHFITFRIILESYLIFHNISEYFRKYYLILNI